MDYPELKLGCAAIKTKFPGKVHDFLQGRLADTVKFTKKGWHRSDVEPNLKSSLDCNP
jgi:hypothetical protein